MKRFVPLSLVFFLTATTGSAMAGSALDPYAHIKPPAPAKEKKKTPAVIPHMDEEVEQTHTYVTMQYATDDPDKKKKEGLIGKMIPNKMPGVGGITAPFVKGGQMIGGGIANGAKASGNLAKKSATVVGSGFKMTGDKMKDSTHAVTKVAHKPAKSKHTANQASLEDMYTREARRAIAQSDTKQAQRIVKAGSDLDKSQSAFLPQKGGMKLGMLNPFNLAKGKKAPPPRPQSGFLDGALNKDELDVASKPAKEKHVAEKPAPAHDAAAGVPETEKIVTQAPAAKEKKSKFPSLNVAKFKPSMPSIPGLRKGKKQQPNPLVAQDPKSGFSAAAEDKRLEEMGLEPVASKSSPSQKEEFDSSVASYPTGDKEIDSVQPKGAPTKIASKPSKKSRLSGLTNMTSAMKFPKIGLRKKNTKAPVPARQSAKDEVL